MSIKGYSIGHVRDIFLVIVYITPNLSSENSVSFFDTIEQLLIKYTAEGDTLLMGDFNARTGNIADCEVDPTADCSEFISQPEYVNDVCVQLRQNCDKKFNK